MFITKHAAEQYAARIDPTLTPELARTVLIVAQRTAEPTGERTEGGEAVWRIRDPDALLVTKHDPACGTVCVTVLHPDMPDARAAQDAEAAEEVLEAVRRMESAEILPPADRGLNLEKPSSHASWRRQQEAQRAREEGQRAARARRQSLNQAADYACHAVRLWARGEDPAPHLAKLRAHPLADDPRLSAVVALCSGGAPL